MEKTQKLFGEPDTEAPSPAVGVNLSQGDHPGFHRLPHHTIKSVGLPTALRSRLASPWSSRRNQFPATRAGGGQVPISSLPSLHRRVPCSQAVPSSLRRRLIRGSDSKHLGHTSERGSRPHGAGSKWGYMQLCHFLSGECSGGGRASILGLDQSHVPLGQWSRGLKQEAGSGSVAELSCSQQDQWCLNLWSRGGKEETKEIRRAGAGERDRGGRRWSERKEEWGRKWGRGQEWG